MSKQTLDSTGAGPPEDVQLPARLREELGALADDASILDRAIGDCIAGAVVHDRSNVINLGFMRINLMSSHVAYRAGQAALTNAIDAACEGVEWVTVNANTTLRHVLNQYGDRLLGFDAKRNESSIQILAFDLVDSVERSVRILVRKAPSAA